MVVRDGGVMGVGYMFLVCLYINIRIDTHDMSGLHGMLQKRLKTLKVSVK